MSGLPLKLPRGFRYSPTDEELINYLRSKISEDDEDQVDFIPEIPFYKSEPWELPAKSSIPTMDRQCFFITQPELKHRRGNRLNRKTKTGFWKPTGNDRKIMSGSRLIGKKKTLVFYEVRASKGTKTSWVTHEYRTDPYQINSYLLYRLFDKREGPNVAGPSVHSPMTSQSHLDGKNSEIALSSVSPSSIVQVLDFGIRTINDGFHAENADAAISDATTPIENQSAQDTFAEDEQMSPSEGDFELLEACLQEPVDATELNEGMNLEKVSPAFPEVSPVTNDVYSSHGGVGLQNGMNENAAYSPEDSISLADLDDSSHNVSGGQKNLVSGFETTMNIGEDNGSCGSNAEHGWVPSQYLANNLVAYSPECWESVFHNPYVFPPIEPLGGTNFKIALGSVSPLCEVQVPDFGTQTINDGFHAENSDAAISDTTTPVENQSAQDMFAELKEGMNLEEVSAAFPDVSPVTNDVNNNHGEMGLQNGMNENAAYFLKGFISLADLAGNFRNESGDQKDLASCFPMNVVSNAEHGRVPWQYWANDPAAYSTDCWKSVFHNPYNVLEKVSPAFPEVSPVTNDVNNSHGVVGLQNGMNENAAYSPEDSISLADLDDNSHNVSGGQKNLASGFETPMNIGEDNGSFSGSNAEHGRVPCQYLANNPAVYSPECWESVCFSPNRTVGRIFQSVSDWVPKE